MASVTHSTSTFRTLDAQVSHLNNAYGSISQPKSRLGFNIVINGNLV